MPAQLCQVERVAADAQDARPEKLEERDERGIANPRYPSVRWALVAQARETCTEVPLESSYASPSRCPNRRALGHRAACSGARAAQTEARAAVRAGGRPGPGGRPRTGGLPQPEDDPEPPDDVEEDPDELPDEPPESLLRTPTFAPPPPTRTCSLPTTRAPYWPDDPPPLEDEGPARVGRRAAGRRE